MSKAKALIIPVTPFQQNCTLLWCEATKRAVVIDPGGDLPDIARAIAQAAVTVEKIWLTHGHIDHVGGAAELKAKLNVPIEGPHRNDLFLLENVVESARMFGISNAANVTASVYTSLTRCSLDDNGSTAIYALYSGLTLNDCTLAGNRPWAVEARF